MSAACAGEAAGRSRSNPSADEADGGEGAEKAMAPSAEPAPAAAEAQRQVQATEALRPDLREAELKLKIESLAEKCAQQERVITHLLADGDQKRALIAQQQQLLARFAAGTP